MYFHVCETQRTRMHVTDITATPNGQQMAVVTCDWFIGYLGTNVSDILIEMQTFSFKKMYLKMSSVKSRAIFVGLNMLTSPDKTKST